MRTMRKWISGLMVLGMGIAVGAQAETVALYTFTGNVATPEASASFISAAAMTVSSQSISYGSVAGFPNPPYAQSSQGWTANNIDDAKFFGISLQEENGATFALTNISFRHRATAAGPSAVSVRINGTTIMTANVGSGVTDLVDEPLTGFTNLTNANIQILGWTNNSRSTTGGGDFRIDDVLIQGTVTPPVGTFPPSVAAPSWSDRTATSVQFSGNITGTGGADVTERGFVYHTATGFDPATTGVRVSETGTFGAGAYSLVATMLTPNTEYFFVAFATNSAGVAYSTESSFKTRLAPPANALVYYTFTDNEIAPEIVAADMSAANFAVSQNTLAHGTAQPADWVAAGAEIPYIESSSNWTNATQASAKHYLVQLEAVAGKAMTITNISLVHRRTGAGPANVGISINGVSVNSQALAQDSTEAVSVTIAGFDNLTNAVVRLEGWNASGTGPYRVDNVLVQGFVDDAVVSFIAPTVAAPTFGSIVGNTAVLGGTIIDSGDSIVVERGIYWSLAPSFDPVLDGTKVSESGSFGGGAFTVNVSGLPPSSTIYFVAFARNGAGSGFSGEDSFITGATVPVIASPASASITDTSVTLSANITSTGGVDVDERGFVYSTVSGFDPVNEGTSLFEDDGGYGTGVFSLPLSGLTAGTQYFFVGYAVNSEGTAYTTEASFTTLPPPPPNILAYYTFAGESLAATLWDIDVTASDFDVSAGTIGFGWVTTHAAAWEALGGAQPYAENSGGWSEDDQASAKNYFFELNTEAIMTITNISFLHRRTSMGPDTVGVSIDGVSIYTGALAADAVEEVSITVSGYVDITNAVITIEGWGDTAGSGVYRIDNVLVQGTTSGSGPGPDPDPEQAEITGFTRSGADFVITFTGEVGATYQLEYTADLTNPDSWIGGPQGSSGSLTDVAPDAPVRFYRLIDLGDN
jgi:hypothetical protein